MINQYQITDKDIDKSIELGIDVYLYVLDKHTKDISEDVYDNTIKIDNVSGYGITNLDAGNAGIYNQKDFCAKNQNSKRRKQRLRGKRKEKRRLEELARTICLPIRNCRSMPSLSELVFVEQMDKPIADIHYVKRKI